jgi:hypothetical protein
MSAVYSIQGAHCRIPWNPERQLIGTMNAHTLLQLESKVRALAHKKHWRPDRQSSHTGRFILAVAMKALSLLLVQYQLISINKLESGKEQGQSK